MTIRAWMVRTAVLWLLVVALVVGTDLVATAVVLRDVDWTPGPLSSLADLVHGAFLWINLVAVIIALVPAYWWHRRGGASGATPLIAFGVPFSILAVLAFWRGIAGDGIFLLIATVTVAAISFVGSLLIVFFVTPVSRES